MTQGQKDLIHVCWSCHGPINKLIFCPVCKIVQPLYDQMYFDYFGLPQTYNLNEKDLEERYFALQRQVHPDRFTNRTITEKLYSSQHSTLANEAYKTLKVPLKRVVYLLQILGRDVHNEDGKTISNPELLSEVMSMHENLMTMSTDNEKLKVKKQVKEKILLSEAKISNFFENNELDHAVNESFRLKYLYKFSDDISGISLV
jgi:molecular chaperone HscB